MPSYMQNLKGTIRKVKGADPLPVLNPEEQKAAQLRRGGFIALRVGYSKRIHAERIVKEVNEHLAQRKDATLSIVQPANEAKQIAVVTAIDGGVPALRAVDIADVGKLLNDATAEKKDDSAS
jgi:hypothetical protein